MATIGKYSTAAVTNLLRHNKRLIENDRNPDIDPERSHLNFSFKMSHDGSDFEHFKTRMEECYIYGRGTEKEKELKTVCSCVITVPNEICGDTDRERRFLAGAFSFVQERYGAENIVSNEVHYDEGGRPHIHIMFLPVVPIDHDKIRYKTRKTNRPVATETGRYEFEKVFVLDEHGERIPVRNYARISDLYDEKISCADVLNKAELQHFHQDLQRYLRENNIEGNVLNGATKGGSISVSALKELTKSTGLTLEQIHSLERGRKEHIIDSDLRVRLEHALQIKSLSQEVSLPAILEKCLEKIESLTIDLEHARSRSTERTWGAAGESNGWGKNVDSAWEHKRKTDIEEEQ